MEITRVFGSRAIFHSGTPPAQVEVIIVWRRIGEVFGQPWAGAYVIVSVRSPERAGSLPGLGTHEIVIGLGGVQAPRHGILDNVGGPQLAEAFALLAPGPLAQWIDTASRQPTPLETPHKMSLGRLSAFFLGEQLGEGLGYLLTLRRGLAAGDACRSADCLTIFVF